MILFESRASVILYNLLKSNSFRKFLLPVNICPIVPITLLKAKVEFDFIDIAMDTLCIDENIIYENFHKDKKLDAVIFVKTFGTNLDASNIFKNIKNINEGIFIIDDCCLQKPDFNYQINNAMADMVLFSTGYSKYVDIGWGGFGFLNDKYNYKKTKLSFCQKDLEQLKQNMQSAISNHKKFEFNDNNWLGDDKILYNDFDLYKEHILSLISQVNKQKKLLNKIYNENLPKTIQLGKEFQNWRFSISVENKENILREIFANNIFASSHYSAIDFMFQNNHTQSTNAEYLHDRIINLFNDFRFDVKRALKITQVINGNM